ncbi:gluconokinase [Raineyella sp. LH-20]|uniref:gluconokinase n=1 Tax=Raineyella sp. LH-20 TaxID=3081204 RepID=UPI002953B4D0|nr:gluconokinase [Raineyella sp. LH-20]WOP19179.1 gluconokinase [Raineyella sp. LH-20]
MTNTHVVVMGVAGSGKSTVARALADRLGWVLAEGDEFHSIGNIAKMGSGIPLTDADRWPWLQSIVTWTADQDRSGHSTVITCSALRRAYREVLRAAPGRTVFVHLDGTPELLASRLGARTDHFMPPALLSSQLATLEPLQPDEAAVVVDIDAEIDTIVDRAVAGLLPPVG